MIRAATVGISVATGLLVLVALLVVMLIGGGVSGGESGDLVAGAARLRVSTVPSWAREPLTRAERTCPDVPSPVLAAQLDVESGWDPDAHNTGSGADGLAQFVPATWQEWGRDGNNDGQANPRDPADAIAAQAAYMCHLVDFVRGQPSLRGEILDLALAAYNAGPGNVTKYQGIPPFPETVDYVRKIRDLANTTYGRPELPTPGIGGPAGAAVDAARRYLGQAYAWGGGTLNGPGPGIAPDVGVVGFDCSGLTRYAVYQGSGGQVTLPRTSQAQYDTTKSSPVPIGQLRPGDLLFYGGPTSVHHVAIYAGDRTMIEAPQSGQTVHETPVRTEDFLAATRVTTLHQQRY